ARDAREALTLLLQGLSFDLILCDVMMPGMSGVDFHVALSQYRPELVKKVVFITGGAFTPRAEQFLETVANRRLTKPIAEQTLRKLIAELSGDD
ncbi:MAG TPA: response regulator, partial [Polyangiaceae bacterium]|nr:response regulator [Polyangiaceae bacterium]